MAYQVLARTWRPRSFKDLVGQEPILRMLTNALSQQRLHHAYLFTGTRGVGKTTLARILAKCLNCEAGISPNPCGQCQTCLAIDKGQFLDLYEVDAASRTKVEETRELLDHVPYPPTQGRYKIYLIDEVHMLSNHSFNALLKTLEEPPAHVKFLLATTDPQRLPLTILSRCLQFHLKRISREQITARLAEICTSEQCSYTLPALEILAQAADGSMRDALSLLDQAIAYGNGAVLEEEVNTLLGSVSKEQVLPLLQSLAAQNGQQLFQQLAVISEHAPDMHTLLDMVINILHQLAVCHIVPQALAHNPELVALAKQFRPEDIQVYYQIALLGKRDLQFACSEEQGFEMIMLRMLAFKPHAFTEALVQKEQPIQQAEQQKNVSIEEIPAIAAAEPVLTKELASWREILPKLELTGMAYALAANCHLENVTATKIVLTLSSAHEPLLSDKLKERLNEAINRYYQQTLQLEIKLSSAEINTPLKLEQLEQEQRLDAAKQVMRQHPQVKQLIEMYDAAMEVSLL
jgi:DNA polymerase III subunit gamma/tau